MPSRTEKLEPTLPRQRVAAKITISILLISAIAGLCSRYPAAQGEDWYHHLIQPSFAPPYWLPFVMWGMVYILIGTAFGLAWQTAVKSTKPKIAKQARKGILLFAIHFIFNLLCPILLIGLQMPVLALIDISILLVFIAVLMIQFRRFNKTASRLLIPYFIWIVYATFLNIGLVVLN